MKFCQDGCRAALFNHIFYWIAYKAKGQPEEKVKNGEVLWYATNDELTEQMAGAWSHCKVHKEVDALIEAGLIGVTRNPKWGGDRTKHFFFGREQGEKLLELCEQHQIDLVQLGLSMDVLHHLNLVVASSKFRCCNDYIQTMEHLNLGNGSSKFRQAITKETTKENNKGRASITSARTSSAAADAIENEFYRAKAKKAALLTGSPPQKGDPTHAAVNA